MSLSRLYQDETMIAIKIHWQQCGEAFNGGAFNKRGEWNQQQQLQQQVKAGLQIAVRRVMEEIKIVECAAGSKGGRSRLVVSFFISERLIN